MRKDRTRSSRFALRGAILSALAAGSLAATAAPVAQCPHVDPSPDAAWALHSQLLTVDTHVDIDPNYGSVKFDPGVFTRAQVDFPKMRAGGLDAAFLVLYSGQGALSKEGYGEAQAMVERKYEGIVRALRAYPDQAGLATSADEVRALHAAGKRAILMGMENAYPLGPDASQVPLWAKRGVRYVSITHMGNNQFGGSSNPNAKLGDGKDDPGLSAAGKDLVKALNDNGIMVDVSHVGKRTMLEAATLSRAPILASHSGAKAVHDNLRNLDDEQLDAIKNSGGVAQMVAFRSYVGATDPAIEAGMKELGAKYFPDGWEKAKPEAMEAFRAEMLALRAKHHDIGLREFVDHIDHAVKRIGIEHVGIASDFDGGGGVAGWDDASQSANVTRELMRRCYSQADISALWGGNLLRVMSEVQAKARH